MGTYKQLDPTGSDRSYPDPTVVQRPFTSGIRTNDDNSLT